MSHLFHNARSTAFHRVPVAEMGKILRFTIRLRTGIFLSTWQVVNGVAIVGEKCTATVSSATDSIATRGRSLRIGLAIRSRTFESPRARKQASMGAEIPNRNSY